MFVQDTKIEIKRKVKEVTFSLDKLKLRHKSRDSKTKLNNNEWCRAFRAKIAPSENQAAEEELNKTIR